MIFDSIAKQLRIIGAMILREATTRFGREGMGFLWVVGEPLLFCSGVMVMWTLIKPEYEHGIRVGPFVMTGYMCLLLLRHMISMSVGALPANVGLLHHKQIKIIHVFIARNTLEFIGGTVAFFIVYVGLLALGQVEPPHDWLLLYAGWFLTAWVAFGLSFTFAGLALKFELMERLVALLGYIMIPMSGSFMMAAWVPERYRDLYLLIPLPHGCEMVRGAIFGEFTPVYYNAWYAFAWGCVLVFVGTILIMDARERVIID